MTCKQDILSLLKNEDEIKVFNQYFQEATEVILFGSYAQNQNTPSSDIDILFINTKNSYRSENVDFITLNPKNIHRKSWLGSEIANHIAKYGLWLKGEGEWKDKTFVSSNSIKKKKERIYKRMISIYLKKETLSSDSAEKLFKRVILDLGRLTFLNNKESVPTTQSIKEKLTKITNPFEFFTQDDFLSTPGREFILKTLDSPDHFNTLVVDASR